MLKSSGGALHIETLAALMVQSQNTCTKGFLGMGVNCHTLTIGHSST